jgi:CheY-like chemotaxis protein
VNWQLPGMSASELTGRIKEYLPNCSVVIMASVTQWAGMEDETKACGADRFLPKPLFTSALADCINECFGTGGAPAENDASDKPDCFAGRRVLLAEDVEVNREIVLALLEPTGLVIDCAENGAEALRLYTENPERYDMIFMDVQMPEMDGYEATRRIRALARPDAARTPIVAMTAGVFREDIENCLASGMDDHVGKPLDLNEIMLALRKHLPGESKTPAPPFSAPGDTSQSSAQIP